MKLVFELKKSGSIDRLKSFFECSPYFGASGEVKDVGEK